MNAASISMRCLLSVVLSATAGSATAVTFTVNIDDQAALDLVSNTTGGVGDDNPGDGTCDVDNTPGMPHQCTLYAAIEEANAMMSADIIEFDMALTKITLLQGLPEVVHSVNITGRLNGDDPATEIDANGQAALSFDNQVSQEDGAGIENLIIHSAFGSAISLDGSKYILNNLWLGVDASGNTAMPNSFHGLLVQNSKNPGFIPSQTLSDVLGALGIGSFGEAGSLLSNPLVAVGAFNTLFGQDNLIAVTNCVISGNGAAGVRISGGTDTTVPEDTITGGVMLIGNRIGTNAAGDAPIPNGGGGVGSRDGVLIENHAYLNFVVGNVIAANEGDGVNITSGQVIWPNLVLGNFIGLPNPLDVPDPTGLSATNWGNFKSGVFVASAPCDGVQCSSNPAGQAAVIAANFIGFNQCGIPEGGSSDIDAGGIALTGSGADGSDKIILAGNLVGVAEFPVGGDIFDLGNLCDGVNISNGTHQIGGPNGADANVIAANAEDGLFLRADSTAGNVIQGNYIGRIPLVEVAMGNGGHGLNVFDSGGNTIGGPGNLDRNVIAHNGGHGIKIFNNGSASDPDAWANLLQRNQIFDNGGLGIDLDDPENAANNSPEDPSRNTALDPTASPGEAPHGYANWRQNAPVICTGAAGFPCVDAGNNSVGSPPGYSGGTTTVMWSLATAPDADTGTAPEHRYRVEFFADNGTDGMTFLEEREVTVGPDGRPTGCTDGVCTAAMNPTTQGGDPINTSGTGIVATATLITDAVARPGGIGDGPANNTSEFSAPAAVPDSIQFSQGTYTVGESDGNASITVSRLGSGAASITLTLTDATTEPADHGALSSTILTWAQNDPADQTVMLPITTDSIYELNETLTLEITIDSSDNAVEGDPSTATVVITDDEQPPTLSLSAMGAAEGGQLVYTVTRNGDTELVTSADYVVAPGAGTEAADIADGVNTLTGTLNIPANMMSGSVSILAVDEMIYEPAEGVTITLSNPVNATIPAGNETASADIAASDTAPVFDIDSPMQAETDANAPLLFTVTKVGLTEIDASVQYAAMPGTATTPEDYAAGVDMLSGTLNFAAATASQTISLTLVGDDTFESPATETFTVVLSMPVEASIGGGTGTATITDDDAAPVAGSLQFSSPTYSIGEAGVQATITVTRTGGSDGQVTVDYATSNGSATAGSDYTAANGTLTWIDGDATDKTFDVLVSSDTTYELDETVNLALSNETGGASLGLAAAVLTITEDDAAPTLSLSAMGAAEGGQLVYTVTRNGDTELVTSADYVVAPGAGTEAADIADGVNTLTGTVSIPANMTTGTVSILAVDDAIYEAAEAVTITLSNPTNATIPAGNESASADIAASDTAPVFSIDSPMQAETDVNAPLVFTVTKTGLTEIDASVQYAAMPGTATTPEDYAAGVDMLSGTLHFAAATASQTISLTLVGDDTFESPATETFTVVLSMPVDASIGGGTGTATITDDDAAPVAGSLQFSSPTYSVGEAGVQATITVTRTGGSDGQVTVDYATSNGSATAGSDYTSAAGTLTWIDGDATDKTFTVPVTNDATDEPDETVNLALSNATGGASLGLNAAVLTISDDDPTPVAGMLQFSAPTYSVGEAGVQATITVTRTGGSDGQVTVDYATSNGSATAGSDYTAANGTLTWMDGDATDKSFTVPVTNDATDEPDETVNLALSNATGGASLGLNAAVLTITDDDPTPVAGMLQFSAPTYSVGEAGVQATITVTRTGGSDGQVTVDYASSNGTATAGSDYTAANGTLTWMDGDATDKSFTVPVTNDATDEPDETVNLALSNATGGASLGLNAAVLTITDDDPTPVAGMLQFSAPTYSVGEAGVQATITVTRTGGSDGQVTVDYATSNGSATAGSDYTAANGTLTWIDGDATDKTFTVAVSNDATDEPDETVNLALSNITGGASLGTAAAVLTITDDDATPVAGMLQFSSATYSISEAGVQATITVTRTGGSDGQVTVDYATSNGSATAGSDYTAANGTLTWIDGDATDKTFTVAVSNDATDEPDETVNLALSNITGGASLGTAAAVLTITDDDAPAGSTTFTGPTSTGTGTQTTTFTGGGPACGFAAGAASVPPPQPLPPGGYVFPHGVFASTINNCTVGASLAFTTTYPQALPAGTVFWKYGRTASNTNPHWYQFPAVVAGNTVTFTLVDGGAGDDDLTANGVIVDPSGPAVLQGAVQPVAPQLIPAMSELSRWLLLASIGLLAALALRRKA